MWSDVWPAMDGVVCLSILLEGRLTVSKNLTKRRQNGSKIGTRDKFPTDLRKENFISNETSYFPIIILERQEILLNICKPILSILFVKYLTL